MDLEHTGCASSLSSSPAPLLGLAAITRMAYNGDDLAPLVQNLLIRLGQNQGDAAALIDLSIVALIQGDRNRRLALQKLALQRQKLYTHQPALATTHSLRVLALAAPGDFMANTPVEFLLEKTGAILDVLYVPPDAELPMQLPDHDVAFVAVAESDENQDVLSKLAQVASSWPRPLINQPHRIAVLTRDGAWSALHDGPGMFFPKNIRLDRKTLTAVAHGFEPLEPLVGGGGFPIIARRVGSHAGEGLARVRDREELTRFLNEQTAQNFYIAPFVDYRSADGLFRKYRIALIDGVAYAVHMAVSKNWMVHYLNADMIGNEANRAEEERFMARFDEDFALRHAGALDYIVKKTGLDYILLDCAETRDDKLLIFETGTAMIVHSLDPVETFPYKVPQMNKIFDAFERMLHRRMTLWRQQSEGGAVPTMIAPGQASLPRGRPI
jgi:hypothetical protein